MFPVNSFCERKEHTSREAGPQSAESHVDRHAARTTIAVSMTLGGLALSHRTVRIERSEHTSPVTPFHEAPQGESVLPLTGSRRGRTACKGFSLVEVSIAVAIAGLGVASLMASTQAYSRSRDGGSKLSQGVALVQEVREWTLRLPFTDPDEADEDPEGSH